MVQPGDFEDPISIRVQGIQYLPRQTADFFTYPLVIECYMGHKQLKFDAYFDDNVVTSVEVVRMLGQLDHLVGQILSASDSDKPIRSIDLISPEDWQSISAWNAEQPVKRDACVHHVFAERVAERPAATAVDAWDAIYDVP